MIYLDNASTTMPYKEVVEAFVEITNNFWGNSSNSYHLAKMPNCFIDRAKETIANIMGCKANEVFFTSGASEGNSWGIIQRPRLWCSAFEHHNYMNYIKANPGSMIIAENYIDTLYTIKDKLNLQNVVVAWQLVNNEVGTIFDVVPMFKKAREMGAFTVCDATQAVGNMNINFKDLGCDMLVASAHKFGGLKKSGFVLIREEVQKDIKPLIYGTQQQSLRGGTISVANAYTVAKALEITYSHLNDKILHGGVLKSSVKKKLADSGIDYCINEIEYTINNTINFSLAGVESEIIQSMLSDEGIFVGVGSGCNDGSMSASSVLTAMRVEERYLHGPIRLSFSLGNSEEEVEKCMNRIIEIYKELVNG